MEALAALVALVAAGVCGACIGVLFRQGFYAEGLVYLAAIGIPLILITILTGY
jgi:hypothetical protein